MRVRRFGLWAMLAAFLYLLGASGLASAKGPQVHVVYPGQTLGMIAKRYNVSIDALCQVNGITRKSRIKPKQRLLLPGKDTALAAGEAKVPVRKGQDPKDRPDRKGRDVKAVGGGPGAAEDKGRASDVPGSTARGKQGAARTSSWKKYSRPARKPGYVTLRSTTGKWQGYALVKGGKVSGRGREGFRKVLASWRTGESMDIDGELIRLLTRVSDQFGGKPIRVVSGFRRNSHSRESRHKKGRAVDFSIEGVPNTALSDYCRSLGSVGVGYYPHSSFVHLDVRGSGAFWVDDSGPGQSPRYRHKSRQGADAEAEDDHDDHDDHDEGSDAKADDPPPKDGARPPQDTAPGSKDNPDPQTQPEVKDSRKDRDGS